METRTYLGRAGLVLATAVMTACAGGQSTDDGRVDEARDATPVVTTPTTPVVTTPATPQAPVSADQVLALPPAPTGDAANGPPVGKQTEDGRARLEVGRFGDSPVAALLSQSAPEVNGMMARRAVSLAPSEPLDREVYAHVDSNPVKLVAEEPVSTFSIDVDTGSYSNVRRFLGTGALPPEDAVRVEEMINYFDYDYEVPDSTRRPFSVNTELSTTPWNPDTVLMQVGIKGYQVAPEDRAPANLVFLVDVSGSMRSHDKLPLLKKAFRLLTAQLDERDRVALVVYAGSSGVVLEPTSGSETATIMAALDSLSAGGRTNGAAGIRLAYDLAQESMIDGGINRVVLATDGDFNVGTVNFEALVDLVERERESGVSLTTLGFGTGNYNDRLMERLADAGDGNHGYIDTLAEARKVLVEQVSSTLQTIARDVKIQIEFNPAVVAEYRLIGYENRLLAREDFNNDQVDAGEIGAGHTVTALYELALVGSKGRMIDPLRYGADQRPAGKRGELAFLRLRYKAPEGGDSELLEYPVRRDDILPARRTSESFRFAAAVAAFGQKLSGSDHLGTFDYPAIEDLARGARGDDRSGYRSEFLSLVQRAQDLAAPGEPVKVSGGPR